MPKKDWKGGPFSLARYCMLREKKEKLFCFSSLGQMVQFDTKKFRRAFKIYFGQFVWIEKKATSIVAFHSMKHRLKMAIITLT